MEKRKTLHLTELQLVLVCDALERYFDGLTQDECDELYGEFAPNSVVCAQQQDVLAQCFVALDEIETGL